MRNIRADLLERLNATVEQRRQLSKRLQILEARERCLRALVSDHGNQPNTVYVWQVMASLVPGRSSIGLSCSRS
jgi:hypothetical protein